MYSIKPVLIIVRKYSVYNFSPVAMNECVHVSVKHTIRKASVTHFSECVVNVHRKVFKVVLSSLSDNAISVTLVNVVKVTTAPRNQYTNPTSKDAIVHKPVFSTSHGNTSPALAVVNLNSSLSLYVCDVPTPANFLSQVSYLFLKSHHQQWMITPRKSVFYDCNYEYKCVSLQAPFSIACWYLHCFK